MRDNLIVFAVILFVAAMSFAGWIGTNTPSASTNVVVTSTVFVVSSGQSCTLTNLHPNGPTNYAFFVSGVLVSNVMR